MQPGSVPHSVMIGDKDVTNEANWFPTKIDMGNLSDTASGNSSWWKSATMSNHIQLTTWKGEFIALQTGPGAKRDKRPIHVQLRAILNFLRGSPCTDPPG